MKLSGVYLSDRPKMKHSRPYILRICSSTSDLKTNFQGAILDLQFGQEGEHIFTASSDNTVGMFDYATGTRLKRMKGHHGIVNAVHAARRGDPLICSASDDATIKIWDSRRRKMSDHIFCQKVTLIYQNTVIYLNSPTKSSIQY